MLNEIPLKRRFSLSSAFIKRTRHTFRVRNSKLTTKRTTLARFLESKKFTIGILVPTIYMLFIHDLVYACGAPLTSSLNITVGTLDLLVFLIFLAEIACNIYAYRLKYGISSLFVLDVIALVSLIPDIIESLFGVPLDAALDQLAIARVARTARIASRLARLPKFVELISCTPRRGHDMEVSIEPSSIAKRLEFRISTKIVLAMVVLLIVSWLCNPGLDVTPFAKVALTEFEAVAMATNFQGPVYDLVFSIYTTQNTVLRLKVGDTYLINEEATIQRTQPVFMFPVDSNMSSAILMLQHEEQVISALSITQTACTVLILCAACALISRDTLMLVVHPIERMLALIKKLTSTISAYTDSSNNTGNPSEYDSDEDSSDNSSSSEGKGRKFNLSNSDITISKEAEMLVEFVDILAQEHMEIDAQRRIENHRRKMWSTIVVGILGWSARRRYQKTLELFRKREHVATELLTTERTYVNSLQVLASVFMQPLKESGVVGDDAVASLFLGLDAIILYNTMLLAKIEKQFEPAWTVHSHLGHIFLQLEDMVDVYSKFVNNCTNATELLTKYKESHPKFAHFIEEQERHPACNHLNISSFLIMPVQRTPRYHLLLDQLVKFTPPDHPDYLPSLEAIETIKRVNNLMNERKRDTENKTAIHGIYMRLEPPVDVLMESHCVFIREGILLHEGDSYMFFLFNCILLQCHAREGGVRLVVVNEIPITPLSIVTPISDSPHFGLKNALQLESNLFRLLLSAPTPSSQAEWVDAIHQCIHKSSDNSNTARTKSRKDRIGTLNLDAMKTTREPRKRFNTLHIHKHDSIGLGNSSGSSSSSSGHREKHNYDKNDSISISVSGERLLVSPTRSNSVRNLSNNNNNNNHS